MLLRVVWLSQVRRPGGRSEGGEGARAVGLVLQLTAVAVHDVQVPPRLLQRESFALQLADYSSPLLSEPSAVSQFHEVG